MRVFIVLLFFLLLHQYAHSQQQEIKGIVADSATYKPLPYVNVRIKNINRGVRSDERGNFSIQATPRDTLVLSFIGYRTIELPLWFWESSVILMPETSVMLRSITIEDNRIDDQYEDMFSDEYRKWQKDNKKLPFYFSKGKKEKIKIGRLANENLRVSTYLSVVMYNPEVKNNLMKQHKLTESEYYAVLTKFNEKHYKVMYYLTAAELLSLLYRFFNDEAPKK